MLVNFLALLLAVLSLTTAASVSERRSVLPNESDNVPGAKCERKTYRFTSTANRTQFNLEALGLAKQINQTQLTQLFVNVSAGLQRGTPEVFQQAFTTGTKEVTQTFSISGIYCEPESGVTKDTLQILVHGVAFDASYWNFGNSKYNVNLKDYSYAYAAAQQGYATFRYDRLGTGLSERPVDGYNVVQGPTEVGVLIDIASKAKNSTTIGGKKWKKTALIGHSYGSVQSQSASSQRPDLIDGVVLTGFSVNSLGQPLFLLGNGFTQAKIVFPSRFGNAPPAYVVTGSKSANAQSFAYAPTVELGALDLARATEQPVTQGVFFTLASLIRPASGFKGPAYVVLGDKDLPFAAAQAVQNGTDLAAQAAAQLYGDSRNATSIIVPETGHGIAIHTTAKQVNKIVLDFLEANELV